MAAYETSLKTFWTFGLVDLYVRTLRYTKGLRKHEALLHVTYACSSLPYFKGVFDSVQTSEEVQPLAIQNHTDAVRFLARCLIQIKQSEHGKAFHLVPMVTIKRKFIRLDLRGLQTLWKHHKPSLSTSFEVQEIPQSMEDVFKVKRKGYTLGPSVQTDGIQLVVQWEKQVKVHHFLTQRQLDKEEEYRLKKQELAKQDKVDGRRLRTKKSRLKQTVRPSRSGFGGACKGLFLEKALHCCKDRTEEPSFVAIDPGICNVWSASVVQDPSKRLELSSKGYYHGIGHRRFLRFVRSARMKRKMASEPYKEAQVRLTKTSLKVADLALYVQNLLVQAQCFQTLSLVFASKEFGKIRFKQQQQKQRFEAQTINRILRLAEPAEGAPAVFAYGNGQFPLSMRGCSGASPHARLMRLLAQQRRVVLVDEYRSTKGCPGCCHVTGSMVQPKGNATYTTKKGHTHHKRVHGLSQCKHCQVLWSRDFAATLNIGKVFKAAWYGKERPAYLCRPTCGPELALSA